MKKMLMVALFAVLSAVTTSPTAHADCCRPGAACCDGGDCC